jgi:hypothetical protein
MLEGKRTEISRGQMGPTPRWPGKLACILALLVMVHGVYPHIPDRAFTWLAIVALISIGGSAVLLLASMPWRTTE